MKVSNRQELMDTIANIIMSTPEEFIDFENIEFDIGEEFIVDGDPKKEFYPGAKIELVKETTIVLKVPIHRKPSVYAYYADKLDDDIENRRDAILELDNMKLLYKRLGQVE